MAICAPPEVTLGQLNIERTRENMAASVGFHPYCWLRTGWDGFQLSSWRLVRSIFQEPMRTNLSIRLNYIWALITSSRLMYIAIYDTYLRRYVYTVTISISEVNTLSSSADRSYHISQQLWGLAVREKWYLSIPQHLSFSMTRRCNAYMHNTCTQHCAQYTQYTELQLGSAGWRE